MTEVRLMTFRSATLAKSVRISSCTPSVKNAFSLSLLRFSKGRTAILFSGMVEAVPGAGLAAGFDGATVVDLDEDWREKNQIAVPIISSAMIPNARSEMFDLPFLLGTAPDTGAATVRDCANFAGSAALPASSV